MDQKRLIEPKPKQWGDEYAQIFKDASVANAYQFRAPYPPQVFEILLKLIPASASPKVVLDAGCGPGHMARGLVRQVDRVDAIDYSAALIAKGRALPEGDNPKLHWLCSPLETAALQPTYSLIVAAVSLHWMEWSIVLPRFADHLAPDGVLAMVQAPNLPLPWHAEVVKVFAKYSMNRDFRSMDLAAELERRGLFQLSGEQTTDPVPFRQSVADWVEAVHGSNGFSRDRMTAQAARECDAALTQILMAHYPDGTAEEQIVGHVTWGKPRRGD